MYESITVEDEPVVEGSVMEDVSCRILLPWRHREV